MAQVRLHDGARVPGEHEQLCTIALAELCLHAEVLRALQSDYKGLRLFGKTRGLTHTNALYLEYLDGVRVPCSA